MCPHFTENNPEAQKRSGYFYVSQGKAKTTAWALCKHQPHPPLVRGQGLITSHESYIGRQVYSLSCGQGQRRTEDTTPPRTHATHSL